LRQKNLPRAAKERLRRRRVGRSGKNVLGSGAFFKNAPVGVQRAKPSDRQASRRAVRRSREWTRAKALDIKDVKNRHKKATRTLNDN